MDLSFSTSASVHLFFLRIALLIRTGDDVKFTQAGAEPFA
jgi:hypothetical protein